MQCLQCKKHPIRTREIFRASWAWNRLHAITRLTRPGRMPLCVCHEHCHFVTWRNKRRQADTTHFVEIHKEITTAGARPHTPGLVPSRETGTAGAGNRLYLQTNEGLPRVRCCDPSGRTTENVRESALWEIYGPDVKWPASRKITRCTPAYRTPPS